jgi:glycyl-tRNA synthetase beta chain
MRVAAACKNDLATQMVGEFPDLQGVMGRYYASKEEALKDIAKEIADHYLPRTAGGERPGNRISALVGLADRLDTLVAMFAKGKIPTGSADPFALRRACLTSIDALRSCMFKNPVLSELLEIALKQFNTHEITADERKGLIGKLRDFYKSRAQNLFEKTEKIRPDTFDAAAGSKRGWENLPEFLDRVGVLEKFRNNSGFVQIAETFKRVNNILKDAPVGETRGLSLQGLDHLAEKSLQDALGKTEAAVRAAVQSQAWEQALSAIAGLQVPVAELFTAVMVNDPDPALRMNRQALLWAVREVVLEAADFSAFQ